MDLKNILQDIENKDLEAISPRREVLKNLGSKVAMAALPFAVGSLFSNKAQGKTTSSTLIDAVNYLLELEYMNYALYRTANNTGGLIPSAALPGFKVVEDHEKAHINLLIATVTNMGGTPFLPNYYTHPTTDGSYVPAAYDFTKGGAYRTFEDYPTFLIIASAFKDLTIRAYLGQMPTFVSTQLLTIMQQVQTTEGRHASFVRLLRRYPPINGLEIPAPWINNNIPPLNEFQPFYIGEDNSKQLNVQIEALPGFGDEAIPQLSATAAFDEPMDKTSVMALLSPYIKP